MAIYSKSMFSAANIICSTLQDEINDTNEIIRLLTDFYDQSKTELEGEAWNLVRASINDVINALKNKSTVASNISNTINSVNNKMINSIPDDGEVNTDTIDILKSSYSRALNDYNNSGPNNQKYSYTSYPIANEFSQNTLSILKNISYQISKIEQVNSAASESLGTLDSITGDVIKFKGTLE